jgi:predicted metal-dependent peptidase
MPWREVLRDWAQRKVKNEMTWNRQNRRHIANGLYLPTWSGESISGLIVANDTSGSMDWKSARSACAAEIQAIAEQMKCKLTILHHDSAVCGVQEWEPQDGPLVLEPRGGGGTSHVCIGQWIEENVGDMEDVAGLICLTDLFTEFMKEPTYPVIWCVVNNKDSAAPFGVTIHVEED